MEKFIDREISALEFNERVLAEGMDPANPLLERLKFIGIVSSNMDEFFMVRMASLKAGGSPSLDAVRKRALGLLERRNGYFLQTLVPELEAAGLKRLFPESSSPPQLEFLSQYFRREILPILTPIAISDDRPLPVLSNLRLYFVAGLVDPTHPGSAKYAVVEIPPKTVPRMVFPPAEKDHPFILAEDLIGAFAAEQGRQVSEAERARLQVPDRVEVANEEVAGLGRDETSCGVDDAKPGSRPGLVRGHAKVSKK